MIKRRSPAAVPGFFLFALGLSLSLSVSAASAQSLPNPFGIFTSWLNSWSTYFGQVQNWAVRAANGQVQSLITSILPVGPTGPSLPPPSPLPVMADGRIFSPFAINPVATTKIFETGLASDVARAYAGADLSASGQKRYTDLMSAVNSSVTVANNEGSSAQAYDASQDILKSIAVQQQQQAILSGLATSSLAEIKQASQIGNANLAEINSNTAAAVQARQTELNSASSQLERITQQNTLF